MKAVTIIRQHCSFDLHIVKYWYIQILVHTELKEITTGYCIPLDSPISISHCSSSVPAVEIINNSTDSGTLINDLDDELRIQDIIDDHNYIPHKLETTEFTSKVVTYITGFVLRKLNKTLKSDECLNALFAVNTECATYALINKKNRGSLNFPS